MFRERNEWPSTAGGLPAEERSGYMELCAVAQVTFGPFVCEMAFFGRDS
jgi:hypothetical protein